MIGPVHSDLTPFDIIVAERDRLLKLLTKVRDAIDFTQDTWEMADEILCLEDEIRATLDGAHE